MELLKNRKFAALVLILVILISTPLGAKISLQRASDKIEDMFYDGVYVKDGDYTSGSIDSYLNERVKASLGLVTVGANYDFLSNSTGELRAAREELLKAETISERYAANEKLETAWTALYDDMISTIAVSSLNITDEDMRDADYYGSILEDTQGAIEMNKYNETVSEFYSDVLGRFPAKAIAGIFDIEAPASFGGN